MTTTTYQLQDGGTITASCAPEFVTNLRQSSRFDSECTDAEYMANFAERYRQYSGKTLRTDNPDNFLDDLIKYAYVKIV